MERAGAHLRRRRPLATDCLPVFLVGRDLTDDAGAIEGWLGRFGASWAILRPDRFVFAVGDGEPSIRDALAELHRQAGQWTGV